MLEQLLKIGTFLKAKFSWTRIASSNSKVSAKSKNGNAAASTGDGSPVQIAEGDIYNISTNITAIDNAEAWGLLIDCFSDECIDRLIEDIKNPKAQVHMKNYNGPGKKKWITGKFKKIPMHAKDPKAQVLVEIKTNAIKSLDDFINTKDEDSFREVWCSLRDELISLKRL